MTHFEVMMREKEISAGTGAGEGRDEGDAMLTSPTIRTDAVYSGPSSDNKRLARLLLSSVRG